MTARDFSTLGEVATFTNGVAFKSSDWGDSGSRIIRIQNLTDPAKPYNRTHREVSDQVKVRTGDLLVSWSATLGVFEWRGPDVALLNQHIFRVQPDASKVDKGYLRYVIDLSLREAERHLHGATMKHVNKGDLLSTGFYCPSLPEQRRIAAVLDRADALRSKRREAVALLDDLERAIFLDMFGDPLANSRGWSREPMRQFVSRIESGKSPQCQDRSAAEDEWGVLKLGAVTKCVYKPEENKALPEGLEADPGNEVRKGDLLFTRKNTPELVAATAYVRDTPGRRLLPDLIFRLVVDGSRVDKVYLQALLSYPPKRRKVQELASGSAASMPNISKANLLGFVCEIPPLDLQKKFALRVEGIERQRATHRAHLATLDELFTSLQQRALFGRPWGHEAA